MPKHDVGGFVRIRQEKNEGLFQIVGIVPGGFVLCRNGVIKTTAQRPWYPIEDLFPEHVSYFEYYRIKYTGIPRLNFPIVNPGDDVTFYKENRFLTGRVQQQEFRSHIFYVQTNTGAFVQVYIGEVYPTGFRATTKRKGGAAVDDRHFKKRRGFDVGEYVRGKNNPVRGGQIVQIDKGVLPDRVGYTVLYRGEVVGVFNMEDLEKVTLTPTNYKVHDRVTYLIRAGYRRGVVTGFQQRAYAYAVEREEGGTDYVYHEQVKPM